MLQPFAITFTREQALSTLAYLKNKYRDQLNLEANMRLVTSVSFTLIY